VHRGNERLLDWQIAAAYITHHNKATIPYNQLLPIPQRIQLKQTQPSPHPLINNTTRPDLREPRRSLSNLNRQSVIDIKNPPIQTSNQRLSFSFRMTAYESVSAALSTNAPNGMSVLSLRNTSTEKKHASSLTHNSPQHRLTAYISSTDPDYPFPRSIVGPVGRTARPAQVFDLSLVVGWGGYRGG
jgi:hypothetical protein